jgi:hypothetical protein
MKKTITLLASLFLILATAQAQSAQYYVLINKSNLGPHCKTATDFTTFTLSSKLNSDQRSKIISVYEKRLNSSEDRKIDKVDLYVGKTDYVIVYEYIIKSDDCPSKTFKYIKAFKASSKEKAMQILQRRLETAFTKDRYISHKILLETQPFSESETSLFNKAAQLLRESTKTDSIKKKEKSTTVGVRG